ncbi:MAG: hypothetical protein AAF502_05555 [Bacteroidota bacterium]
MTKVTTNYMKLTKQFFWIGGGLLLLVLLLSAIQQKRSGDSIDFQVEIMGKANEHFITEGDVRNTIKRRFGHVLNGIPIGSLDLREVEKVLESDPFILNADVYVDALSKVRVRVNQRQPLIRVVDGQGTHFYLDYEGKKMPLSANFTPRVVVASGYVPVFDEMFLETEEHVLKQLFDLAHFVKDDPFLNAMIEQFYVNSEGDIIMAPKIGKHKIILGSTDRMAEKLDNLKVFYREGLAYTGWSKYKTINLKFKGQVVCSKT